ncbi:hypothetical protein TELCIR_07880 [Teladorsagia circumcincta]|uniref:Uncharacterized protein n=1 Tax=Teladorsagia circumcincta TaxID=45464 RepID=A0A2G9UJ42_TELCI|nr:hypothetical protein TELCIR_07880 [Teladorsagia circumcincta]
MKGTTWTRRAHHEVDIEGRKKEKQAFLAIKKEFKSKTDFLTLSGCQQRVDGRLADGSAVRFVDPVDRYAALIVRGTIVGMGLAGVALFLRNSRLFARFEHVAQIPKEFIRKELQLKGTVREASDNSNDAVDADVTVKKNAFSRTNLNIEVVRRGYARVPPPESPRHLKALQSIPAYSRLVNRLLTSEKVADRRGVGIWERDSWVESVQSYPSQVGQIIRGAPITKFIVLVFTVAKDVLLYGVKLTQETYAVLIAACAYIAHGYRRFASGVDRLTDKYNKVRQRFK